MYDTMGVTDSDNPYAGAGGPGGEDPFSAFSGFWNSQRSAGGGGRSFEEDIFDDFANFFNMDMGGMERKTKGQDIVVNMELDFIESVNGTKKEVVYEKRGTCSMCGGNKCKPGTAPSKCVACGGKGTINFRQGPMTIQMTCSKCRGVGVSIKHPCPQCKGNGIYNSSTKEEINIPRGINNGQNLRVSAKGNQSQSGGPPGDLIIKINVKNDSYFKREGYDVITDCFITISQAVLGSSVKVKTLYGDKNININRGTQHGTRFKLSGLGITKLAPHHDQKGDQIVIVKVHIPTKLSEKEMKLFKEISENEEKIDPNMNNNNNTSSTSQKNNSSGKKSSSTNDRNQEEENIFNMFKNMWK